MRVTFRCRAGHHFEGEGEYRDFDRAIPCSCGEPAWMLIESMPAMHGSSSATVRADRAAYAEHNVCFTDVRRDGEIIAQPTSHASQCGCEACGRHRKRAAVTEVADMPSRKSSGKEVRL